MTPHAFTEVREVPNAPGGPARLVFCAGCGRAEHNAVRRLMCTPLPPEEVQARIARKVIMASGLQPGGDEVARAARLRGGGR